jgi:hypothetical protein
MVKWGIDLEHCCRCMADTADNMNSFGKMLEEKHNTPHGYCIDHIMQLMAKMAFQGAI